MQTAPRVDLQPGWMRREVHVASFGHPAVVEKLGCVLSEELIAPDTLVPEFAGAADALRFADSEVLAHLLGPPFIEGAVDRVLRATVEDGDQRLHPQITNRAARHRTAGIYVGELDVHLTALASVVEEVLGAAPAGAEVVLWTCP